MWLYLVRHGKAELGAEDADRALSIRGRSDIEAMAQYLAAQDIAPVRICHSTLARARQTAEIFSAAFNAASVPQELEGVEPWGDVKAFVRRAQDWTESTMVCGHQPFMGDAATCLLTGDTRGQVALVKTGTVMAFERISYGPGWQMRWMLTPRLVRGPKAESVD